MAIFKLSSILKKLKSVGIFNYVFENNWLKRFFGQNTKKLKILKLSRDFRNLQKLALKLQECKINIFSLVLCLII